MRPDMKKLSAFFVVVLATLLTKASASEESCITIPEKGAPCYYPDECALCYCLGPENYGVNAPVAPITCNGDISITVSLLYWQADQDGMQYAIENELFASDAVSSNAQLNVLVDAEYIEPSNSFDFGFKLGTSYTSACDGWDLGVLWTHFQNISSDHIDAAQNTNHALLPLWSVFQFPSAGNAPILFTTRIASKWKLDLDLIDIDLGRQFWVSKYLSLHPHIGLRVAILNQDLDLFWRGGSWNDPAATPENYLGQTELENEYRGIGTRAGVATNWNFGCGWSLYGDASLAIIYGKFKVDHKETLREAVPPSNKIGLLDTHERFHASRGALDLALGVQWSALICDCKYGFTSRLGWEQYIFFHQNQLWRVTRLGGSNASVVPNNTGENIFQQRQGNLSAQGLTLSGKFTF